MYRHLSQNNEANRVLGIGVLLYSEAKTILWAKIESNAHKTE